MITAAIFDVDGTLLDTMPMWEHAAENYLISIGYTPEENLAQTMYTFTMERAAVYLQDNYGLQFSVEEIIQGMNNTIHNFYKNEAKAREGVVDFIEELHTAKIPMAIATSTDREHIEAALTRLDLSKYFQKIFTCSEVGVGKVKPDIYLQAAGFLKSDPSTTWVFEDAYHAAETAKNAGFLVVGIYDNASAAHQDKVAAASNIYIKEFTELTLEQLRN